MHKILYLSQFDKVGGGETSLLYLLQNLDKSKFEPIVILPKAGEFSKRLKKVRITTHFLDLPPYLIRTFFVPGLSMKIFKLFRLIKKINPSIIHINNLSLIFYGGICGKLLRIPVVATSHGAWDLIYPFHDLIYNLLLDNLVTNSNLLKNLYKKRAFLNPKKLSVINFGIDTNLFKPGDKIKARKKLNLPQSKIIITIAGRIDPIKDHLTFLKAAKIVISSFDKVLFLIVGSKESDFSKRSDLDHSYLNKINKLLDANPLLKKSVKFLGYTESMAEVYSASDLYVSSSLSESFSLGIMEALASALPIVSTSQGIQSELIFENKTGFLVPPQNPSLLAQKISLLIKNPRLRKKFGVGGRKHIINNFPVESYVKNWEEIYLSQL